MPLDSFENPVQDWLLKGSHRGGKGIMTRLGVPTAIKGVPSVNISKIFNECSIFDDDFPYFDFNFKAVSWIVNSKLDIITVGPPDSLKYFIRYNSGMISVLTLVALFKASGWNLPVLNWMEI